jgi:uncharacterized protein YigE (DUF2233 family)
MWFTVSGGNTFARGVIPKRVYPMKCPDRFFQILIGVIFWVVSSWVCVAPRTFADSGPWKNLEPGLDVGEFKTTEGSVIKVPTTTVVRIDPNFFALKLLCASELGKVKMTVKDWCQKYNLIAGINAGMYLEDGITSLGYLKNFDHVNNPRVNGSHKSILAFNRLDPGVPQVQIIDLACQDFESLRPKYQTLVQSIRMIGCHQENVWTRQVKRSSMAVLGMDKSGNLLFIFTETPYSGHDFINLLLSLPLSLHNAMYLEGGPVASLYLSTFAIDMERVGAYGTDFLEEPFRGGVRPVPNIIGIARK